jgi:hypothetical protein
VNPKAIGEHSEKRVLAALLWYGYEVLVAPYGDNQAAYCPELDAVYLVPVEECGAIGGRLRVDPPRNGQTRGVRWARAYELRAPDVLRPAAPAPRPSPEPPA